MVTTPTKIFDDAIKELEQKRVDKSAPFEVPYRYLEVKYIEKGYSKKKAFDWITTICEIRCYKFEKNYIRIE